MIKLNCTNALYGKKVAYEVLIPNTSVKVMMSNLLDFEEEESFLQSMGYTMRLIIDCTLKFHGEFAGEGIKYSWGCSKVNIGGIQ